MFETESKTFFSDIISRLNCQDHLKSALKLFYYRCYSLADIFKIPANHSMRLKLTLIQNIYMLRRH